MDTVSLFLGLAQENTRWGYRRTVEELKKRGIPIGAPTVWLILKGSGVQPAPDKALKKLTVPWTAFVHAHMDAMGATESSTRRIYTPQGVLAAYVFVAILSLVLSIMLPMT
jgi:hypothetical protein